MSIKAGIGISDKPNAFEAGREAAEQAMDDVKKPKIMLVFSSTNYDQEQLIDGVRQASNNKPLIGCSDSGEITNYGVIRNDVVVMALGSDTADFALGLGGDIKEDSFKAGARLAHDLKVNNRGMNSLVFFTDVLTGNGTQIIKGLQSELGEDFKIVGAAAGDDFLFKETYTYLNSEVYPSSMTGLAFSGKYKMGIGVGHGWSPIGLPVVVTKSSGSIVEEIDGRPAISFYEENFGMSADEMKKKSFAQLAITYPLGMRIEGHDEMLIRCPIEILENGAIRFAAEIQTGTEVRLMLGSKDEALKAARAAAENALKQLDGAQPSAAFLFSDTAREKLLAQNSELELKTIQDVVGDKLPIIGFYTYGGYSPVIKGKKALKTMFHNESVVVVLLA